MCCSSVTSSKKERRKIWTGDGVGLGVGLCGVVMHHSGILIGGKE